jgi:micrococcal nuclease
MLALVIAALVLAGAADGDTLTVRDGTAKTVLRLAEIDAPERTQPYSKVSRRNLIALCKDKSIEFTPVSVDRYGRTVARVYCDGVHVNFGQVRDGFAMCFLKYLTTPDVCLPLESEARQARRGLWREDQPMPPWQFRTCINQSLMENWRPQGDSNPCYRRERAMS